MMTANFGSVHFIILEFMLILLIGTVYCLNVDFFKSTDGGVKFDQPIEVPHGDNHDLWIDPNNPQRMIAANDGGGTVSVNGGKSWTAEDYITTQFYHVTTTNHVPYHVAGAQQDIPPLQFQVMGGIK